MPLRVVTPLAMMSRTTARALSLPARAWADRAAARVCCCLYCEAGRPSRFPRALAAYSAALVRSLMRAAF
jgi:hypothetical protein